MAVKGKFHTGFSQKFGFLPPSILNIKNPVWIHAVSVGEALVAANLCEAIKARIPGVKVIVSTTTRTGNEMIRKSSKSVDGVFYYPIDVRRVVKNVLNKVDPSAYVIVETELWPNMLEEVSARSIPLVLVNGRISDRSFLGYKRIGFITKRMLGCFSSVCVQTQRDAEKIKALGCPASKIRVTGNVKFDISFPEPRQTDVEKISEAFPEGSRVIVAGSTHYPEEKFIIDEFIKLRKGSKDVKLVVAPRHIERKDAIKIYVESFNLKCCFFSGITGSKFKKEENFDVIIVDTIGHLKDIYSRATVVFIGGSLAKKGGQNPIEAARWGKAVIFGPNMDNFREVARNFIENGAAIMVEDPVELGKAILEILNNDQKRMLMEKNSREVIEKNSGAIEKTVEAIELCLKSEKGKR